MQIEQKIVKTDQKFDLEIKREDDEEDEIHKDLDLAMEENKKVRRLIDMFVLGLFLIFIMYTYFV